MPPRRWLVERIFSLPLLLLRLHAGGPLTAQILQTLVVLRQVHIAALAGVHDLLLGNAADGLLHHRLLLGRALGALALGALAAAGFSPFWAPLFSGAGRRRLRPPAFFSSLKVSEKITWMPETWLCCVR